MNEDTDASILIFAPKSKKRKGEVKKGRKQPKIDSSQTHQSSNAKQHKLDKQKQVDVEKGEGKSLRNAGETSTSTSFKDLGLNSWLSSICKTLGMKSPTIAQQACIPPILSGKDVVACAETGGGKTAAYLLPALQILAKERFGVFALILVPTRELAFQAAEQLRGLGGSVMDVSDLICVGGMSVSDQANKLSQKPHFVFATPGRLKDILIHDSKCASGFKRLKMFILDEADRLLDPTFEEDLRVIVEFLPSTRQTLLFSATITKSILTLQRVIMQDAFTFSQYEGLRGAEKITDQYIFIPEKVKEVYLYHILQSFEEMKVRSAIIFVRSCERCHNLSYLLDELDISAVALHSNQPQKQRLASLAKFKSGVIPILVATDVASRGLDIPTVDLVINFDLPPVPREYIHRIGRTGRAGRKGRAVSFVTQYSVKILKKIEQLLGKKLDMMETDENKVLKEISRVFSAKKAAYIKIEEENII